MPAKTSLTTLLCLLAIAALPAAAGASSGQLAVFEDNARLAQSGPGVRDATLDELQALGVDVIKFQLPWADVAGHNATKPAGFDGRDQADYPNWGPFDGLFNAARARGFRVMIAIGPPVPGWATKRRGDRSGVDRPSATEYGRFVEAAGNRYRDGDIWTLKNEPNHRGFLYPQSTRRGIPYAPRLYRSLVRAGAAALARSGNRGDRILFGELLPIAPSRRSPGTNLRPVLFLREFFCLDSRLRPYRGRAARARGCTGFRRITGVNGFAYHPYTRAGGLATPQGSGDNATITKLGRITRVLDAARRRGRISGGRLPIWNTEFGYQSNPPDRFQARLSRIPGFINEAEWISFRSSRVASFSQYTLTDDPLGVSRTPSGSWQGGLRFNDGRPKPGVYDAFRMPLFVRLLGPSAVEVWGAARPGGAGSQVQVQQRSGSGAFANLGAPIAVSNARGYFRVRYRISRASRRSFRFLYAGLSSRTAKAVTR